MKPRCDALQALAVAIAIAMTLGGCDRPATSPSPAHETAPRPVPAPAPPAASTTVVSEPTLRTVTSADGSFTARIETRPDPIEPREPFEALVELFRDAECTTPLDGEEATLFVDAAMPHHGHGMNVRSSTQRLGVGRYRIVGMLFHMPGRWELFIDRTVEGVTERAQITLEIADAPVR